MAGDWWVGMTPTEMIDMALNHEAGEKKTYGVVIGIDPGSQGYAVALSLRSEDARIFKIPSVKMRSIPVVDMEPLRKVIRVPAVCWMEQVRGRGGWGASSNFSFGAYAGAVASLAVSYGWNLRAATPQEWQAGIHLPASGSAKDRSMRTYNLLYGNDPLPRKRSGNHDDNLIDAFLIALYGVRCLGLPMRQWVFKRVA